MFVCVCVYVCADSVASDVRSKAVAAAEHRSPKKESGGPERKGGEGGGPERKGEDGLRTPPRGHPILRGVPLYYGPQKYQILRDCSLFQVGTLMPLMHMRPSFARTERFHVLCRVCRLMISFRMVSTHNLTH